MLLERAGLLFWRNLLGELSAVECNHLWKCDHDKHMKSYMISSVPVTSVYLRRGGIYNSIAPPRCQVCSCLKTFPPQTKSIVPIDKSFSVVLSQPVIRSVSVTVQPQNYKVSTVPAVQTTAKSLKTSTAQPAHQLTKSMKRRRSLHTQDHLPQCN